MCGCRESFDIVNDRQLLDNVKVKSELFRTELAKINAEFDVFTEIRGKGLLLGCALNEKYQGRSRDFLGAATEEKLMSLIAGPNVIRFAPSLIIPREDIVEGLTRFKRAIARVVQD